MAVDKNAGIHERRGWPKQFPVTGAWQPGDDPGAKRFFTIGRPIALEGGGLLEDVTIAYESWGELNEEGDNAILICHALTGDAHVTGGEGGTYTNEGWWSRIVGPGKAIDTDRWFVVCANVLGGCQGTTGPASVNPATGKPYGSAFPQVSVRDIVRTQAHLGDHLGVGQWFSVVGGSMGGMIVLEWAAMFPDRVRSVAPIATSLAASAQQIGWSAVGRLAIANDPNFHGGDYYDDPMGPGAGLAVAREIALIHYRSDAEWTQRFGRDVIDRLDRFDSWGRFQVEGYLDHHGKKFPHRFDANSYIILNRVMDLHDTARGRGGYKQAFARFSGPSMTTSVSSDFLYPAHQQAELAAVLSADGRWCEHHHIDSIYGHDGFLVEHDKLGPMLIDFFDKVIVETS
ncbi:MAG: homoserine O-acetyltransferase [Acidimicrobiales bacterium]|nr:homoserine O-acetyltransferase [Acidimicrobiia bacterium]NNC80635.1 homoserine O-acetyltransferase [Acidimicrobiales bacterium]RZV47718.1 MAG: homoserine O-acetyltransferase [Acidimicrobiales bacterium]